MDMHACADLEPELERLYGEGRIDVIALDLRGLDFMDSSALRTIVVTRNQLVDEDRRLVLVRGPQAVQRVFEITRMTERLEFVDAPEHVHT
jgi:anti-sigma B factor antagonist